MHSIINFHPFVDGNKRAALLAVDFYLHWNGYRFMIPKDADSFTIEVAKGSLGLNDILFWIQRNSLRTLGSVITHWLCVTEMSQVRQKRSESLTEAQRIALFPLHAVSFFSSKILEEKNKRLRESSPSPPPVATGNLT